MQVSRNNLLFVLLFAGGIVLPTAILSILSFRNIQNEIFLAQKNFDENLSSFQSEVSDAIDKELSKIYQETKAASLFLYEQPQGLLDFGHATEFKSVEGIEAIFLFNKGKLVYPDLSSRNFFKSPDFPSGTATIQDKVLFQEERRGLKDSVSRKIYLNQRGKSLSPSHFFFESSEERIQNILGLIRFYYKSKKYAETLKLLELLESMHHPQGYLHADLTRAVNLLHFEILVKEHRHEEAQEYCLSVLAKFLDDQNIDDISSSKFFFESAFTQILSFEKLSQDKREAFWNLRENFNRQLGYMDILHKHKELFQEIFDDDATNKEGILYLNGEDITLFKMSYPYLSGDQVVIAKIDPNTYRNRLLSRLKNVTQSFKNIPFSITENNNKVLLGEIPENAPIIEQYSISEALDWEFTLYEKDMQDIRKETRHRMFLMYGLMLFALITVIFGSFFMFRFITQERKLLSMKTNFLSSVSHELKTPLTSIKMFAEMMARGRMQRAEKVQEYSTLIGKEASRLENLIGAILNYTRMEHGTGAFKWEKLDFSICAKKVFDAVEDIGVEKGLTFYTHFEPNVFVMGDYTALYSLVQNLIDNAIKYTEAPGDITVNVKSEDDWIVFSVADTGIGIPSSEQKNIFNDFYRVGDEMTRSTKGSGLGLATVKRVAETHKATISLNSKPGKGSTFTVKFKKAE
ncbi:HAMP domain-containing sensor histidine kinase [uncultured Fibrobacter sp.]|uniref:sensor histidine kinase n=1 Tax=uncultured Fibrobacter sp. TaxID=261512 RepID=UPI0026208141|nr:HAMP domain-containing sensor histidine kinase [uncultured Fibrobacter sp.]